MSSSEDLEENSGSLISSNDIESFKEQLGRRSELSIEQVSEKLHAYSFYSSEPSSRRKDSSEKIRTRDVPKVQRIGPTRKPKKKKRHSHKRSRSKHDTEQVNKQVEQIANMAKTDERVKINVGGKIFETYASSLIKYPDTLLGTMFQPRNRKLLAENDKETVFFDRNPRCFELILDFYRTGALYWSESTKIPKKLLREECKFFQIPWTANVDDDERNKRISMELMKMNYKSRIAPATEYKKITRLKLLSEHHGTLVMILDIMAKRVRDRALKGHNSSTITFFSPLHYTESTPREIFNIISIAEIRDILIETFREKDFKISEKQEYSKAKTTDIIGLRDEVTITNDPKYFIFKISWNDVHTNNQ